jgi:hypothetical protein
MILSKTLEEIKTIFLLGISLLCGCGEKEGTRFTVPGSRFPVGVQVTF